MTGRRRARSLWGLARAVADVLDLVGHATDAVVTLGVRAATRWWSEDGGRGGAGVEFPMLRIARDDDPVLAERTRSGV